MFFGGDIHRVVDDDDDDEVIMLNHEIKNMVVFINNE